MSTPTVKEVYGYVQERCLWQFFSRSWDRTENINGILDNVVIMLSGVEVKATTPMERLFYADSKILADQLRQKFPGITGQSAAELKNLFQGVKDEITDLLVVKSKNRELHVKQY